MKKKTLAALLAGVLAASALAGCGTKKEEGSETASGQENEESGAQTEDGGEKKIEGELELALFQGGYGADYWEELIARFEEKYPDVHVTYEINPKIGELIRPKIISGDVPDLIYHNMGQSDGVILGLIKDHALLDITDLFEEQALDRDEKLKDVILPGKLESKAYSPYGDGKIYLAPFNTSPTGLIYNKTLFEEKGWEVPETWDEFFELGDKAKEDERALITFAGVYPSYFESLLNPAIATGAGMDAMNSILDYEEGSFENEKVQEVLKNVQKIVDGGYLLEGTTGMNHTQSQSEFMLGKALFIPNGTWIENEMKDAPREGDDEFEFALLPALKLSEDDTTCVSTSIEQLSIPKKAKNPEAAKEFIKFIYTEESVKLFGEKAQGVISVKGATELVKDNLSTGMNNMFSVLDRDDIQTFSPAYAALPANAKFSSSKIYEDGLIRVMNGELDVKGWTKLVEDGFADIRELQEQE